MLHCRTFHSAQSSVFYQWKLSEKRIFVRFFKFKDENSVKYTEIDLNEYIDCLTNCERLHFLPVQQPEPAT